MATRNQRRQRGRGQNNQQPSFSQWCVDICREADGQATLSGMELLGPIDACTDLLLSASASDGAVLAAEQLVHLVEGWRYIAASVNAVLSHAPGQALHLAYYAELRAAVSLYAWSGIRVKQNDYYYMDAQQVKKSLSGYGTHQAAWGIWKEWCKRPDAQGLFGSLKLASGVTLESILQHLRYVDTTQIASGWGIDLWDATIDRNARNVSSYEAELAQKPLIPMSNSDVSLILDLWRLFLRDETALGFDTAFINYIVAESIPKIQGQAIENTYDSVLNSLVERVSRDTGIETDLIVRRLDSALYPSSPFKYAADSATDVLNVLCRGFCLLRMAMLAAEQSIGAALPASVNKWITNWLYYSGILNPEEDVELLDIEEDYRLSIESLDAQGSLPSKLWTPGNSEYIAKIIRPDACIAWGGLIT